ncbi:MAG: protease complex subunit PrcB family protein [Fimbriimonadaceae bacterium]|nr:protease complex subunit PrcB family protein [Fimbriimonadaceae bacterium]
MKLLGILLFGGLLAVVGAASAQLKTGFERQVTFFNYQSGTNSRIESFETRVLQTEGDFQVFWSRLTGSPPSATPRDVNWNENYLIAINLGRRSNGGYSVYVRSIERPHPNDLVVNYVERKPGPDTVTTQALTSPWTIVRLPRTPGNVRFAKAEETVAAGAPGGGTIRLPGGVTILPGTNLPPPIVIVIVEPWPWWSYRTGTTAALDVGPTTVIASANDYEWYWSRLTGVRSVAPTTIDWNRESLVGIRGSSEFVSIVVEAVGLTRTGDLAVRYREEAPTIARPGTGRTVPYRVVRVPKPSGRILVERRG